MTQLATFPNKVVQPIRQEKLIYLHDLSIRVTSFKQKMFRVIQFGVFDLQQVGVEYVANVVPVESLPVVVDDFFVELEHLAAVHFDFVFGGAHRGKVLCNGDVVDGVQLPKKLHALLDHVVELGEFGVVAGKAHRH